MKSFEVQWKKITETLESRISKVIVEAAGRVFNETVERTPVGNPALWSVPAHLDYEPGSLKAAWQISYGTSFVPVATSATSQFKLGNTITIKNELPYAQRVEFGWSSQAPNGMARLALKNLPRMIAHAAKRHSI